MYCATAELLAIRPKRKVMSAAFRDVFIAFKRDSPCMICLSGPRPDE
jgi:hypothetical protein